MSGRRTTTLYDVADLRVRPDGSRVSHKARTGITAAGTTLHSAGQMVQTTNGRWIAQDAGGDAHIVKRPRIKAVSQAEAAEELGEVEYRTAAAREKQAFAQDDAYLAPKPPAMLNAPSSDLLKIIHYESSLYYTQRGQLTDATRAYRALRKKKKLKAKSQDAVKDSEENAPVGPRRDMYRALDGSALMVIGMLLQERILSFIREPPSENEDDEDADEDKNEDDSLENAAKDSEKMSESADLPPDTRTPSPVASL